LANDTETLRGSCCAATVNDEATNKQKLKKTWDKKLLKRKPKKN
jgi:hypothetical protein